MLNIQENDQKAIVAIAQHVADFNEKYHPGFEFKPKDFIAPLQLFLEYHGDKTPEQLSELAEQCSDGGAHTNGLLVRCVREYIFAADPTLVAAVIYHCWSGGKIGFQFLPDPASVDEEEYLEKVEELMMSLREGVSEPSRILVDSDREFFDNLPDKFTVYRGAHGISPERASQGVCWTTRRDLAEWFAQRGRDAVLVSARVRKDDVALVLAGEHEIVVTPRKWRQLKCGAGKRPKEFGWNPGDPIR